LATQSDWQKLRYFKPNSKIDQWGDPSAISPYLLFRLDDFRHYLGTPIVVTRGVAVSGHATRSFHYKENGSCAVDVIIPGYDKSPYDLIIDATRFGFTGIGLYMHWKYKGEITGGLHLDTRPLKWEKDETLNFKHSRWLGVLDASGKQVYKELSFVNIMKYWDQLQGHKEGLN